MKRFIKGSSKFTMAAAVATLIGAIVFPNCSYAIPSEEDCRFSYEPPRPNGQQQHANITILSDYYYIGNYVRAFYDGAQAPTVTVEKINTSARGSPHREGPVIANKMPVDEFLSKRDHVVTALQAIVNTNATAAAGPWEAFKTLVLYYQPANDIQTLQYMIYDLQTCGLRDWIQVRQRPTTANTYPIVTDTSAPEVTNRRILDLVAEQLRYALATP